MKKKMISCLLIIIVVIISYFYAHVDKNSYIYDRNADTSTFYGTGVLLDGETITQTFVVEEDTIDGVNIKMLLTGNAEDVFLNCKLLDENQNEVSSMQIAGKNLKNNKFNKLEFSQIEETKGKQFTLELTGENSDERNGVSFYVSPEKDNEQELNVNGKQTDGVLVTRVITNRFDIETFLVVLGMVGFIVVFMKVLYKYFK